MANESVFTENYRFLARYNRWFNERLYTACEQLTDEERKRDRGAFFGSIHTTLNHLIWGDQTWLRRFAQQGVAFRSLGGGVLDLREGAMHETVLYPEWGALRAKREQLDAAIEAWTQEMPDDFSLRIMRYGNSKGVQREHPAWQALTHFFNHQAHHRGQVTTLLSQAGIDPGVTDLIALV
jgi:uncharacterized damage-inducible protein DinB